MSYPYCRKSAHMVQLLYCAINALVPSRHHCTREVNHKQCLCRHVETDRNPESSLTNERRPESPMPSSPVPSSWDPPDDDCDCRSSSFASTTAWRTFAGQARKGPQINNMPSYVGTQRLRERYFQSAVSRNTSNRITFAAIDVKRKGMPLRA